MIWSDSESERSSAQRGRAVALLVLSLLFVAVCMLSLLPPRVIESEGDTAWFRAVAEQPLTSPSFWFATRAWGYPALLKFCGLEDGRVIVLQLALHIASHLFLAWAFFLVMRRATIGLVLGCAVLALAMSPHMTSWSVVLLAESLAISLGAALLGVLMLFWAWLERESFLRRSGAALAVAVVVLAGLLAGTRDNWPYFLILVATALLLPASVLGGENGGPRSRRTVARIVAASLVALALFQVVSARVGHRWRFGLTNLVLMQVLPDPVAREHWARSYGLPVDDRLLQVAQTYRPGHMRAAFRHGPFQRWLDERGLRSYTRELIGHPLRTAGRALEGHRLTRDEFSWEYSDYQGDGTLPARLSRRLLYRPLWIPAGLDFLAALLPTLLVLRYGPRRWRPAARVLLLLGLYLPAMSALSTLADPEEIYRHTLQVALGLRLLGVTGVIWIGALLVRRYTRLSA